MIEAVNSYENGPYLLDTTARAMSFLDAVGADNIELQYDVYHMQRMEGNLADTITRLLPRIGHVQIADPPGRGEPGTGEINYRFVLDLLERSGYRGLGRTRVQPVHLDHRGEPRLDQRARLCQASGLRQLAGIRPRE